MGNGKQGESKGLQRKGKLTMPNSGFNVPPLQLVSGRDISAPANTRLDAAGTISGGVLTVTKTLVFKVPDGANPRAYNAMDVFYSEYFPQIYSVLAEDARMHYTGDAEITHWCDDGRYITVDLTYTSQDIRINHDGRDEDYNTDTDGRRVSADTPPWKLKPQEIRFTTVGKEMPTICAYNSKGELFDRNGRAVNPVVSTAGEPFKVMGEYLRPQMSFTYYVKSDKWKAGKGMAYANSINSKDITVCGTPIYEGTGLLLPIQATKMVTYESDSTKVKWRYWKLDVTIACDPGQMTFSKTVLNVGDRAYFPVVNNLVNIDWFYYKLGQNDMSKAIIPATPYPEQIVTFHPFVQSGTDPNTGKVITVPNVNSMVWCGWQQFLIYRNCVINAARQFNANIPDPQCEQQHDIPLDINGFVDFNAINTKNYLLRRFWNYRRLSWGSIGLPK